MIVFRKVRWRNFLSTGNNFTVVDLNASPSTLIVGANGSGKSTLLDALSFGLFGKPHRDINKPQLINSINGRDCEVEIEFSVNKTEYMIRRGLKPGIFEIYRNGQLLNQESHSRDYQKVLEQNILKLNHKSFHQVVVLGSSSFIPFMQLPNSTRRAVIEDLLDINIFTKMNSILKEKVARLREMLGQANHEVEMIGEKIRMQEKHIADLKSIDAENAQKNQNQITILQQKITELQKANDEINASIKDVFERNSKQMESLTSRQKSLQAYRVKIDSNATAVRKEINFYESNDQCPTCAQPIDADFKTKRVHTCKKKHTEFEKGKTELVTELKKTEDEITRISAVLARCTDAQNQIIANNLTIGTFQRQITALMTESSVKNVDVSGAEKNLLELREKREELSILRSTYYEEGSYNQIISEMLKDTGIKTKVIRQYLPVMNKLINQYLQVLDFFVSFSINESFEESIKSRHRDDFTYASFSEGEKQRIDLALLFTWRQIAKMKNSVSTNLLILDETFDSSMDADGVENLIKILDTLEDNTNVFIISHKTDSLDGKFSNRIEFEKKNSFSEAKVKNA